MNDEAHHKVTARHLSRDAYLYVRQSTLRQVVENTESTERQYALRKRAVALGWPDDHVVVIDSDLGRSGASAVDRAGFQRLVADVGMGRAGIVLGLEVSRLARNSTDWHRLLEICALTDTLILDEDGIYDPAHFNDRLLLGLKGTMSEAELHLLRARMRGGLLNKARRGELHCSRLPVGFVYDSQGRAVLDPDAQVQQSVHLLFTTYFRTGAAHATIKYFRKQGLLFPTRVAAGPRKGELIFGALSLGRVSSILHNPWYAGTYAYGRTRSRKHPDGTVRSQRLPASEWLVVIHDAHASYITWQQHLRIEQQLMASVRTLPPNRSQSSPREGPALLQGRALCGLCGSRMHVRYCNRRGRAVVNYVCWGRGRSFGDALCQSMVGTEIDAAVGKLLGEALTPMALELSMAVQREITSRLDEADRLRHRQVERAQYEADCARQRYMLVDPANRLVADSLEADWNARLRALTGAHDQYERQRLADRRVVEPEQQSHILALATSFPVVWNDPNTPQRERKRMLALLIDDVTLIKQREVTAAIRFRAGATTTITLPRPQLPFEQRATHSHVRALIDELLGEYTDASVAHILNERGLRTGAGEAFDGVSVQWVRSTTGFKSLKQRLVEAGMLTAQQLSHALGVGRTTLRRWHLAGRLQARICDDHGQWLYWLPDNALPLVPPNSKNAPQAPMVSSPVKGAV